MPEAIIYIPAPRPPRTTLQLAMEKLTRPLHGGTVGEWHRWTSTTGAPCVARVNGYASPVIGSTHSSVCAVTSGDADADLIAAAPALHFALWMLQANPNDPRAHRIALDALALVKPQ
jgi:hypothetical protein